VKVLLVVIDAATPRVVCPAIETGQLPTLQRLARAGAMHQASATIFPSITPAATTSIITGHYPSATGIVGASWFDELEQRIAYYGDDFWVVAREGFREFLRDFLVRLNGDRLTQPTLLETIEQAGLTAGSLNYLVYRGLRDHKVNVPFLLNLLPGVHRKETVKGPTVLCIGDFVCTRTLRDKPLDPDKDGLLHRFGMDDAASGELLIELMADGEVPDFTVAYFADNDYRSHEVGPHAALGVVERVDAALGRAFEGAGGLERVLQNTYVIVTSDHGHCEVLADRDRAAIRLHEVLAEFPQATLGETWKPENAIMICPNMRAAQIYFHPIDRLRIQRVIDLVLVDQRVDLAMWRTSDTRSSASGYTMQSQIGALEFWIGGDGPESARDAYGTVWSWRGDLAVADARVEQGTFCWGNYPNAFERIAGALDAKNSATLWVTARPGCEFEVPGGEAHLGGASHGALHALESLCPVILAGPTRVELPRALRSIDIAPLCLQLLGLPSHRAVGGPAVGRVL
jgi:arylsulfatase A-like enzyme